MKNLFYLIDKEISSSKSKFKNLKLSSISETAKKFDIFTTETQRLNKVLTDSINSFLKSNDLTDSQVQEIKDYTSNAMTDFITKSGVPGINPNFKIDIK